MCARADRREEREEIGLCGENLRVRERMENVRFSFFKCQLSVLWVSDAACPSSSGCSTIGKRLIGRDPSSASGSTGSRDALGYSTTSKVMAIAMFHTKSRIFYLYISNLIYIFIFLKN